MIILGFLLIALGAVFGLDFLWKNKFRVTDPTVFGQSLGISSGRWLFVIGVIVGVAIAVGVALVLGGIGRKGAKAVATHKEMKGKRHADENISALRVENDDLRRKLDQRSVSKADPPSTLRSQVGTSRADNTDDDPIGGR